MKKAAIVGSYIKLKRTEAGLSQKALGMTFEPPVTTQFISNIERGATPLPAVHISKICQVLKVREEELVSLMEREYASKLTHKVGIAMDYANLGSSSVSSSWFKGLLDAYEKSDMETQRSFQETCERIFPSIKQKQ